MADFTNRTTSYSPNLTTFSPTIKIRYLQSPTMPLPCHLYLEKRWHLYLEKQWHLLLVTTCIKFDWSQNVQTPGNHQHFPSPPTIRKVCSLSSLWQHINIWLVTNHGRHHYPHTSLSAKEQRNTPWHLYHWCVENNTHRWTPQRRRKSST